MFSSLLPRARRWAVIAIAGIAILLGPAAATALAQNDDAILIADFSGSTNGFVYNDANDPTGTGYVTGSVGAGASGDGLTVTVGGVNKDNIFDMSGAWSSNFTLSEPAVATITLDYRVEQTSQYENDEYGEARVAVDGNLVTPSNGSFPRVAGGGTAGWTTYTAEVNLSAGSHRLELIGFNNKKTWFDEVTVASFDNITITVPAANPAPVASPAAAPAPIPGASANVLSATYSGSADGFNYGDVSDPTSTGYVNGSVGSGASGGGLTVTLGGVTTAKINNMAGAWTSNFALDQPAIATITLDYRVEQASHYENDEYAEARVAIDGNLLAPSGGSFPRVAGGSSTDWITYAATINLSAGSHTIELIGFNNKKTWNNEVSVVSFDNVSITVPGDNVAPAVPAAPPAAPAPTATAVPAPTATAVPAAPAAPAVPAAPAPAAGCAAGVRQAEAGLLSGTMDVIDEPTAEGGQFVQARVGTNGRPGPGTDYAEYCVTVPTAGDYRIDATVWAPNANDDSFYVTVGTAPHALWDMAKNAGFATGTVSDRAGASPMIWNLAAGDHTVRFHHREDGAGIDSFQLVEVAAVAPIPTPLPAGITFFNDPNRSGNAQSFQPGVYSGANGFSAVGNNQASSFEITPGHLALVCTNGNASGTCRAFGNPKDDLGQFSLNNNISYVQLRQNGEPFVLVPGNDVKQIVNRLPAGTDFVFTPGTYTGQAIIAKDNMTFTGQAGAILDGNGLTTHAISGVGDNVVVQGLEIIGYVPGWMQGVISARNTANFSQEGKNWIVQNNNLHHNEHAAINVASGMIVRGNKIHNNGQIGISGLGDNNNHLDDVTIDNNEVYNNATNVNGFRFTWHEGGMKFIHAHNLKIINNTIWDNYGRQIFCDVFCDDVLIEGNNIETSEPPARRNRNSPIMFEISSNGTIRNNTIDLTLRTDINDTGVRIAESQNVVVESNDITVRNPFNLDAWGFDFRSQNNRAPVGNVVYRDNSVTAPDGPVKVGDANAIAAVDMYFYNNDYAGEIVFKDNGGTRSWSQWKNQGRDTGGSFTP